MFKNIFQPGIDAIGGILQLRHRESRIERQVRLGSVNGRVLRQNERDPAIAVKN